MTREEAKAVTARVIAAIRDISDPVEQVRVGAKVVREETNRLANLADSPHHQVQELRKQIEELNTRLLHAERGIGRRVVRNVELVRENYTLKTKAV